MNNILWLRTPTNTRQRVTKDNSFKIGIRMISKQEHLRVIETYFIVMINTVLKKDLIVVFMRKITSEFIEQEMVGNIYSVFIGYIL